MKSKNYLLHGATNCGSSNYGDYIYADMIYTYLKKHNKNVTFFQPSTFFVKNLKDYNVNNKISIIKSDSIIYIPGGYFGEGPNASFKDNIIQFLRFLPLGIIGALLKKNMVVLGIGAGPLNNFFMKNGVKIICNNSKFITTRDKTSYECLKKLTKNKQLYEAEDLILTYKPQFLKEDSKQIKEIKKKAKDKKIFLIHFNHDMNAMNLFSKTVNLMNSKNDDYYYVVASDSILKNEDENIQNFKSMSNFEFYHFKYTNPYELSTLLNIVDVVLTSKLHVGVVSSLLNKSVFAVSCHYEKTKRFYKQIKNEDRCIDLNNCTEKDIYKLILKKEKDKIIIPEAEIEKSKITWNLFSKYIGADEYE